MRPDILFLHGSDQMFGSDRVLLSAVDAATAEGMSVRVLLPDDEDEGWLSSELLARGVETRKAPLAPSRRRYAQPSQLPRYLVSLLHAVRTIRAEAVSAGIVHINTSELIAASAIRRQSGRRLIWHVHELITAPQPAAWFFRVLPMVAADEVVAISQAVAANLLAAPMRRAQLHCVLNGIPPRPIGRQARDDSAPLCLYAGRLNRWKGYELFVEAVSMVATEHPSARFMVAGSPPAGEEWRRDALRRQITELELEGRLEFVGLCEDVPALFDLASVVVVPSRLPEPLGLVTLEAMRSGCAVIASAHGGTLEIITHDHDGLLVPPDDAAALAGALRRLLSDTTLRRRLAEAAIERVREDFSEERFKSEIVDVWRGRRPPLERGSSRLRFGSIRSRPVRGTAARATPHDGKYDGSTHKPSEHQANPHAG